MMITEQEAIHTLYQVAGKEQYKQTTSWTRTRTFTMDEIQRKQVNPFVIDERFVTLAKPDSYTSTQ
jgi:6-phosphogluconolactonase/glucosamine-6-phosphate isomerase/deaminase